MVIAVCKVLLKNQNFNLNNLQTDLDQFHYVEMNNFISKGIYLENEVNDRGTEKNYESKDNYSHDCIN